VRRNCESNTNGEDVMDDKYIQFGKDLEKLILDFNNSRKKYHKRYIAIKLLAIFFSTASTITISLSFVEECQVLFKIISVILSGISTILISFDKVTDYKSRWQQRTITFVKLQEIKRLYKYFIDDNNLDKIDQFQRLVEMQNEVMRADLDLWKENVSTNE
jgi:hypothetical protein